MPNHESIKDINHIISEIHKDVVFVRIVNEPPIVQVLLVVGGGKELDQNDFHEGTESYYWFDQVYEYIEELASDGIHLPSGYYM